MKDAVGYGDQLTMGYTHLAREHLRSLVASAPNAQMGSVVWTGAIARAELGRSKFGWLKDLDGWPSG